MVADHLSRIEGTVDSFPIRDDFPDEQLLTVCISSPWFADIVNFLVASVFPPLASRAQIDKIKSDAKYFIWDDPYLWKLCNDQFIRRCIPDHEIESVLRFCHASAVGGHFGAQRTARKVLDSGFYWPTIFKDAWRICSTCEQCQRAGSAISWRQQIPQQPMLFCEVFDVWGIDFMGPFPVSFGFSYILLAPRMPKLLQVFCALVVPYVISCSSLYILLVRHLQYYSDLDEHENIFCICIKTKS